MKSIFAILAVVFSLSACSTYDSTTDTDSGVQTESKPNSMTRPADMGGSITEGGVNVSGGDTTIQETDGHKITVTDSKGDTTITPAPGIDQDTIKNRPPRRN